MKRIFILVLVLLLALGLSACFYFGIDSPTDSGATSGGKSGETDNGSFSAIFDGKIVSVSEGFILIGGNRRHRGSCNCVRLRRRP